MGIPIHNGLPQDHPDSIRLREINEQIAILTNLHIYYSKEQIETLDMFAWHEKIVSLNKEAQKIMDKYTMKAARPWRAD